MLFLFSLLFSLNAYSSAQPNGCGVFEIYGRLEKSKLPGHFQYVVNGKTISKFIFTLSDDQEIKMAPYFERPTKIRASILKPTKNFKGEFLEIISVKDSIPDPAFLIKNHGFVMIKKELCK